MTTPAAQGLLTDEQIEWLRANLVATIAKDTEHCPILTTIPHIQFAFCAQAKLANSRATESAQEQHGKCGCWCPNCFRGNHAECPWPYCNHKAAPAPAHEGEPQRLEPQYHDKTVSGSSC